MSAALSCWKISTRECIGNEFKVERNLLQSTPSSEKLGFSRTAWKAISLVGLCRLIFPDSKWAIKHGLVFMSSARDRRGNKVQVGRPGNFSGCLLLLEALASGRRHVHTQDDTLCFWSHVCSGLLGLAEHRRPLALFLRKLQI